MIYAILSVKQLTRNFIGEIFKPILNEKTRVLRIFDHLTGVTPLAITIQFIYGSPMEPMDGSISVISFFTAKPKNLQTFPQGWPKNYPAQDKDVGRSLTTEAVAIGFNLNVGWYYF